MAFLYQLCHYMDPESGEILFITEVGSRMWGMEEFASDYDWVHIYQVPTRSILEGRKLPVTRPQKQYTDDHGRFFVHGDWAPGAAADIGEYQCNLGGHQSAGHR